MEIAYYSKLCTKSLIHTDLFGIQSRLTSKRKFKKKKGNAMLVYLTHTYLISFFQVSCGNEIFSLSLP